MDRWIPYTHWQERSSEQFQDNFSSNICMYVMIIHFWSATRTIYLHISRIRKHRKFEAYGQIVNQAPDKQDLPNRFKGGSTSHTGDNGALFQSTTVRPETWAGSVANILSCAQHSTCTNSSRHSFCPAHYQVLIYSLAKRRIGFVRNVHKRIHLLNGRNLRPNL